MVGRAHHQGRPVRLKAVRQADAFLRDWLLSRELARRANLQVMREEGLGVTPLTILNLLDADSAISVTGLASRMNVHPSTIVRSLDAMEERGLIERARNPVDRREVQVRLAAGGEAIRSRLYAAFADHTRAVFQRMPAGARRGLVAGMRTFVEASGEGRRGQGKRQKKEHNAKR